MAQVQLFLSTPSARRATCPIRLLPRSEQISIHALREEGDAVHGPENLVDAISIHALREEGDWAGRAHPSCKGYFYPRPPRGGRRQLLGGIIAASIFLSTPSARRATWHTVPHGQPCRFLSTPSARRATSDGIAKNSSLLISIHALREEGDGSGSYFSSCRHRFLSTPSARRAT